jgi:hypothetical protein
MKYIGVQETIHTCGEDLPTKIARLKSEIMEMTFDLAQLNGKLQRCENAPYLCEDGHKFEDWGYSPIYNSTSIPNTFHSTVVQPRWVRHCLNESCSVYQETYTNPEKHAELAEQEEIAAKVKVMKQKLSIKALQGKRK